MNTYLFYHGSTIKSSIFEHLSNVLLQISINFLWGIALSATMHYPMGEGGEKNAIKGKSTNYNPIHAQSDRSNIRIGIQCGAIGIGMGAHGRAGIPEHGKTRIKMRDTVAYTVPRSTKELCYLCHLNTIVHDNINAMAEKEGFEPSNSF